jgi:hypothetical protein
MCPSSDQTKLIWPYSYLPFSALLLWPADGQFQSEHIVYIVVAIVSGMGYLGCVDLIVARCAAAFFFLRADGGQVSTSTSNPSRVFHRNIPNPAGAARGQVRFLAVAPAAVLVSWGRGPSVVNECKL